jgi:MinD-like ATPase involved in chromosome partitioning or flagellar assembly
MRPGTPLTRREVYPEPIVDGRPVRDSALTRLRGRIQGLLVSSAEREEAELERLLRSAPGVTRANVVAVVSPKGGVGKTTTAFLVGNLLASHRRLRVIAVDANPGFGTLADLAPGQRSEHSLAEVLAELDDLANAAQLRRFVSLLPSGLQLLAAPHAAVTPDEYGRLLAFLSMFYEVVILDLGTGLTAPIARLAIERADQLVLVTTPDWVASQLVLSALDHLEQERTTVLVNKATSPVPGHRRLHRSVVVPHDEQLQLMLDSGAYSLAALPREVRLPVKRLALAVSEQLV